MTLWQLKTMSCLSEPERSSMFSIIGIKSICLLSVKFTNLLMKLYIYPVMRTGGRERLTLEWDYSLPPLSPLTFPWTLNLVS